MLNISFLPIGLLPYRMLWLYLYCKVMQWCNMHCVSLDTEVWGLDHALKTHHIVSVLKNQNEAATNLRSLARKHNNNIICFV